jgi:cell division protein FtsN
MFQERDGEKEILLGNKQLLGIFFVLAVLFGVFFTAGYMVGHTASGKPAAESTSEAKSSARDTAAVPGETHAVAPEPGAPSEKASGLSQSKKPSAGVPEPLAREAKQENKSRNDAAGTAQAHASAPAASVEKTALADTISGDDETSSHKTYLQVAALNHSDAVTVAKVLSKKGFRAHVSPKTGTPLYRVLVGPVKDAGDLNATRAALKSKGFREVFVQHL